MLGQYCSGLVIITLFLFQTMNGVESAGVSTHMCLDNSEYNQVNVDPALTVSQLFANARLTSKLRESANSYGYTFYFLKDGKIVNDADGKALEVKCLKLTDKVNQVFNMLISHKEKIDSVSVLPTFCWQQ